MEKVEDKIIDKKQSAHSTVGIIIGILVLLGVIEFIAGGFLYLKFEEKQQDMDEREELLFRQAASIEFKQVGINKSKAELEALDIELTALEAELKMKEEQLKEQKKILDSFRSSIKDTVSLLEPKKIAENTLKGYLDKYGSVDLSLPIPCNPRGRALFNAARLHLDAIQAAGEEISKTNKYTQFVAEQKAQINTDPVDCEDGNTYQLATQYQEQQSTQNKSSAPQPANQAIIQQTTNQEDEEQEEEELLEEDLNEEEEEEEENVEITNIDESNPRVSIKVDLSKEMKRRDSAFKSLEE